MCEKPVLSGCYCDIQCLDANDCCTDIYKLPYCETSESIILLCRYWDDFVCYQNSMFTLFSLLNWIYCQLMVQNAYQAQ